MLTEDSEVDTDVVVIIFRYKKLRGGFLRR